MNKITVYRATDGKDFETELECLDYEESLQALEELEEMVRDFIIESKYSLALIIDCLPDKEQISS